MEPSQKQKVASLEHTVLEAADALEEFVVKSHDPKKGTYSREVCEIMENLEEWGNRGKKNVIING